MAEKLQQHKTGLIVGAFMGLWHVAWSILVVLGLAQWLLDFIYKVHFLNNPFTVAAFSASKALALIVVTAIIGYIAGSAFALLWNKMHGR